MNTRSTRARAARPSGFLLALGVAGALAAACGSGSGGTSTPAAAGGTGAAPTGSAPTAAASLNTSSTSLGTVLVGPDGHTVYLFEKDTGPTSNCAGACSTLWPAVTTTGTPTAVGAAQTKLVGTTSRADGTTQVTYAGHPLYYFAGDKSPGDVKGEGLKNFGASWYVLMPNGQKIDED